MTLAYQTVESNWNVTGFTAGGGAHVPREILDHFHRCALHREVTRNAVTQHVQLTGVSIKNVATKAAFHAPNEHTAITMHHVTAAARSEFAKLQIPLPDLQMRAAGRA